MRLQARLLCLFVLIVVASLPVAIGQRPPTLTLRQRIIASGPGVPTVQVTVDRRRVPLGTIVTFSLAPAAVVRDPRFTVTLNFGDGKQQSVGVTKVPHLYQAVGTYFYSVEVKTNNLPPRVVLNANPVPVDRGGTVSFLAQAEWAYPNLQYRFNYGDGASSGWQDSPRASHAYGREGNYSAYVDIGDKNQPIGGSTRTVIAVNGGLTSNPKPTPDARPTPNVIAKPTPKQTPKQTPVSSPSPVDSPSPNTNTSASPTPSSSPFGSGSPSPGATASSTQNNGNSTTNRNSNGNTGGIANTSPSPDGTSFFGPLDLSRNWWKYLLLAALILFLIYQATGLLTVARPTFAAFSDPGVSQVAGKQREVPINFQLLLNRNVAAGDYSVETGGSNLVKNSDRLEERQILEI